MIEVVVDTAPLDVGAALGRLEALGGGGVASFTGLVRGDGGLTELLLEHHADMTSRTLERIAGQAQGRWALAGILVHHRIGPMVPGDRIVLVATAARHRGAALEACAFTIDWLKTRAPFWKRESFADGSHRWVEARDGDAAAAARWE